MGKGKGHEVDVANYLNVDSFGDSHSATATKELVAADTTGKKTKVTALTIATLDVTLDNIVQITDGSGGDVKYEIELGTGLQGVQCPSSVLRYLETSANTALHLKLSAAQKVTYSLSYYQEV